MFDSPNNGIEYRPRTTDRTAHSLPMSYTTDKPPVYPSLMTWQTNELPRVLNLWFYYGFLIFRLILRKIYYGFLIFAMEIYEFTMDF